jgi:hypothetical protein
MALPQSDKRPLHEFLHELRRVRWVLGRAEERLGDVIDGLEGGPSFEASPDSPAVNVKKFRRRYAGAQAREAAARGVSTITRRVIDAGTVCVSIDGGPEFALSPALADLLAVVSSAEPTPSDGFVAFQSLDTVIAQMTARGRRSTRRAVIVGISRLRGQLRQHNYPPLLVETSVRLGVRFRLRVPR